MTQPAILYLDPFSGIAGDMFVGALLDLGLDLARLHHELAKLNLGGYQLSARRVQRGGISAMKFDVQIDNAGHQHRTLTDIRNILEAAPLSEKVKNQSLKVFTKLAEAEGKIHNMPAEQVHFHEVGAIDSIVDTVGACVGMELLGIETLWCGPVALGSGGFVKCEHGLLPVPVPATAELMRGWPLRQTPVEKELTTPTGAALVAALATPQPVLPPLTIEKIGYGAGTREEQSVPNVLRAIIAHAPANPSPRGRGENNIGTEAGATSDTILEIRANIDDAAPEVLGYLAESLLAAGVLDVFFTAIQMKKSRPATMVTVLAEEHQLDAVAALLFREGSTFGLRYERQARLKLARQIKTVQTPFGEVRVKIGSWLGQVVSVHPEFDDCRARAKEKNVPLRQVIEAAKAAAR
ncbi:MAG TPA: nickel pincer cofactor biosynthesis protein LarC [Planctomycetota bacterium]|jgi:hypothetical protein